MDIYLGIDFGAENIMVSYRDNTNINKVIDLGDQAGKLYMKNYFALDAKSSTKYYGKNAKDEYRKNNEIIFFSRYKQDLIKEESSLSSYYIRNKITPSMILKEMMIYLKGYLDNYLSKNLGSSVKIKKNCCNCSC